MLIERREWNLETAQVCQIQPWFTSAVGRCEQTWSSVFTGRYIDMRKVDCADVDESDQSDMLTHIRQRSSGRAEMILFLLALLNAEATDERVHAGARDRVKISLLIFEVMRASIVLSLDSFLPPKVGLDRPPASLFGAKVAPLNDIFDSRNYCWFPENVALAP